MKRGMTIVVAMIGCLAMFGCGKAKVDAKQGDDFVEQKPALIDEILSPVETPSGQENNLNEQELDEVDKKWEEIIADVDWSSMLYPLPEVSTVAEIEAGGRAVTPQDLLNALNYLLFVRSKCTYYDMYRYNTEYVAVYNSLSTKFVEITPNSFVSVRGRETLPFYYPEGGYVIIVKYMEAFGSETMMEEGEMQLEISEAEFEKVMKYLQVNSFELTKEYLEEKNENGGLYSFEEMVGTQVYEGILMTEELIRGITDEECLKLFMTVVENQTKAEKARLLQN